MSVFIDNFVKGFEIGRSMKESEAVEAFGEMLGAIEDGADPDEVMEGFNSIFGVGGRRAAKSFKDFLGRFKQQGADQGEDRAAGARSNIRISSSSRSLPQGPSGIPDPDRPWLRYNNQSAQRNLPLSPELVAAFDKFAPEMGLTVEVRSGGQGEGSRGRVGSRRHDDGNAADVVFYKDGKMVDWSSGPEGIAATQEIIRRARAAGITGVGVGPGYMAPGMLHLGLGREAVWGAGGKGINAPDWASEAFWNWRM